MSIELYYLSSVAKDVAGATSTNTLALVEIAYATCTNTIAFSAVFFKFAPLP
jgi:hypothetical protein